MIFVALLGLFILSSTGCQKVTNDQTGRIIVKITDEPFPIDLIEEASVTITRVEIRSDEEVGNEDENEVVEEGEVDEKGEGDEGETEDKEGSTIEIPWMYIIGLLFVSIIILTSIIRYKKK